MRYKLFLSDFDGTLLRSDGTISEASKRAIERYTAAGGVFVVCTGRMLSSILPRLEELGIREGLVAAYQGATIADVKTGELLKNDAFAFCDALSAVRALERDGHHIQVYTPEGLFCNRRDEMLEAYEKICRVRGTVLSEPLSRWLEREKPPVIKVLAMLPPEERHALKDKLQRELGARFYVTCSAEWLVEIMPAGQNKGAAVGFLADYYGVAREEVAVIGDQLNDLPMLEAAGGKFTVKNGEPELKEIARTVPSNDDDGVAAALNYAAGDAPAFTVEE